MSHLRVLICRVDDESKPDQMAELHSFDLPSVELEGKTPETTLDGLEAQTLSVGQEIMRHLLLSEWEAMDKLLVEQYQQRFSPRSGDV